MTLTIELTPVQEAKLEAVARKSGTDPIEFVKRLVEDDLSLTVSFDSVQDETFQANGTVEKIYDREPIGDLRSTLKAIPETRQSDFFFGVDDGCSVR